MTNFLAEAINKLNVQFRHFTTAASLTRIALLGNKKKQLAALFSTALARKLISNGTSPLISLNMMLSPSSASLTTLRTPMTSVNLSLVPLLYPTVMRLAGTGKSFGTNGQRTV